ncbi:PadR family transcriptional regulator [Cellulomonas cellasea]|uniref:PadR family transcriptional regulator n=1 Tax=Cellulomonas cellasea TaxID=43670 RepID=UPI000551F19E|nr:PadR family transcriptional regulator [Cellulomonas cellasea]
MTTPSVRRRVANPLALAVLACLWERPMYPYEITTTLRERGKEDSIRLNFGALYAVIKQLEKHGLIGVDRVEREGNRPERVVYAITDDGRAEAVGWLRELVAVPAKEYPAFETGLSLIGLLAPDDAVARLHERIAALDADVAAREAVLSSPQVRDVPEMFLVEATYRNAMLRAEREFTAGLLARIEDGTLGGVDRWARWHALLSRGATPDELAAAISADLAPVSQQDGGEPARGLG